MSIEVKPDNYVKVIYMSLILPLQLQASDKRTALFLLMCMKAASANDSTEWNCKLKFFSPT